MHQPQSAARHSWQLRCDRQSCGADACDEDGEPSDDNVFEDQEVEILDLYEYCHYVNLGDDMQSLMRAMSGENDSERHRRFFLF